MTMHAHGDFAFHPYAMPRRGAEPKWDGWYDLMKNGSPVRTFVRVPSREGFDDPDMACQAAEILAEWDIDGGHSLAAR